MNISLLINFKIRLLINICITDETTSGNHSPPSISKRPVSRALMLFNFPTQHYSCCIASVSALMFITSVYKHTHNQRQRLKTLTVSGFSLVVFNFPATFRQIRLPGLWLANVSRFNTNIQSVRRQRDLLTNPTAGGGAMLENRWGKKVTLIQPVAIRNDQKFNKIILF